MASDELTHATKTTQKFYKTKWFWVIIAVLVIIGVASSPKDSTKKVATNTKTTAKTVSAASTTPKSKPAPAKPAEPSVPAEYKSALSQADTYANTMHMSKQGVYDQLVSQYGGQFTPAAAQYAIDNVKSDWNANALAKAKDYQNEEHLSPAAIHDQLISQYGEKFTPAEADYAIQHLND